VWFGRITIGPRRHPRYRPRELAAERRDRGRRHHQLLAPPELTPRRLHPSDRPDDPVGAPSDRHLAGQATRRRVRADQATTLPVVDRATDRLFQRTGDEGGPQDTTRLRDLRCGHPCDRDLLRGHGCLPWTSWGTVRRAGGIGQFRSTRAGRDQGLSSAAELSVTADLRERSGRLLGRTPCELVMSRSGTLTSIPARVSTMYVCASSSR
jgi:hypothetical protein